MGDFDRVRVRVPASQREAIRWLASAPDETVAQILSGLREAKPAIDSQDLASQIAPSVRASAKDVERLTEAVLSLAVSRNRCEMDTVEAVANVTAEAVDDGLIPKGAE